MKQQVITVSGGQWGDEGKGKIAQRFAHEADVSLVVRAQGGNNAGHTIYLPDQAEPLILGFLPSGVVRPKVMALSGPGTVIDPQAYLTEVDLVESRGISLKGRLFLSSRATLIAPWDIAWEEASGQVTHVGTTKRGIGPAYEGRCRRDALRAGDVADWTFMKRAEELAKERNRVLKALKKPPVDIGTVERFHLAARALAEKVQIVESVAFLHDAIHDGKSVLIEGAQGTLLDVSHGTYPYVTSSPTTVDGLCWGVGLPRSRVTRTVGVFKSFLTRVGSGPFPTKIPETEAFELRKQRGEFGARTGRPRDLGHFDAVLGRYACQLNGFSDIVLTKLDQLAADRVCLAVGLRTPDGTPVETLPASIRLVESLKPEYLMLPGWIAEEVTGARVWNDLPPNAQFFVRKVAELLETPVSHVSVGPLEEDLIAVSS